MKFQDEILSMGCHKYRVLLGMDVTQPEQMFVGAAMRLPRYGNKHEMARHAALKACGKITEADYVRPGELLLCGAPIDWTLGHLATRHLYVSLQPGVAEALRRFSCDGEISLEFIPWPHAQKVNINMRDGIGIASYPAALLDYGAALAWYEQATGQKWGA